MILVVSDSSPIIVLVKIQKIQLLEMLFRHIAIPPAVADELSSPKRPKIVRDFVSLPPSWVEIRSPRHVESIPRLHPAECEAISLARESQPALLLVDERRAYKAAVDRRIHAIGTIGVIERAAEQNLLDLEATFNDLKRTDFWISAELLDARLERFHMRRNPNS